MDKSVRYSYYKIIICFNSEKGLFKKFRGIICVIICYLDYLVDFDDIIPPAAN